MPPCQVVDENKLLFIDIPQFVPSIMCLTYDISTNTHSEAL